MYIPRRYEEKDKEQLFAFIRENSFAILVSIKDGIPIGSHIPLLLEKNEEGMSVLVGHISKGNEQKQTLQEGTTVLAIFSGPHSYISPTWYTQLNVPTWNYIAVHVYGKIRIMEGQQLWQALSRLVDYFEQSRPCPLKMEEIPEKILHEDFRGIVGFEIQIETMQAAYKLSQNRDAESYDQVIRQLEQASDENARKVAEEMKKRKK